MLVIRKKLEMLSYHSREKEKLVRGSDAVGQILFLVLHTNSVFPLFCSQSFGEYLLGRRR